MHKSKLLLCLFLISLSFSVFAATRCEDAFQKTNVDASIATCRQELQGPIKKDTRVAILETLGKAYISQGETEIATASWVEASQYLSPAKTKPKETLEWTHLQVLIGQTYSQTGQASRAQTHLQRVLEQVENITGKYSLADAEVLDALGGHYALQKQSEQAAAAFRRARIIYEVRLGKANPKTIDTRLNHAVGLLDMGKENEAYEMLNVLANIVNKGDQYKNEPIRAEVLTYLATLQMKSEQLDAASRNYQAAFEVRQNAFGPDDLRTSQALNNLGVVLYRLGDLNGAENALSKAYVVRKDKLGEKDPLTISTQKNLQAVISAQKKSN